MEGPTARSGRKRQLALRLADVAAAAVLTAGALADVAALGRRAPLAAAVMLSVACTTSVAWRRRAPAASAFAAATAMLAYQLVTSDPRMTFEPYAVALCYYLLGRQRPAGGRRIVQWSLLGYGLLTLALDFVHAAPFSWPSQALVSGVVFVLLPAGLGALAARYARMTRALAANLAGLEREHELRTRQAADDERNRVARELHDVLGHCVSVMVIQAGAAQLVAASDPDGARGALENVQACGREALADLRRIMDVARHEDLAGPVPGLAQLGVLAERAAEAGVPTDLRVDGADIALPDAVGLTCYRVVQEALTNVVKHASAARAQVRVRVESGLVSMAVTSTGPAATRDPDTAPTAGHGLTGLRERVALHGGWLEAGPCAAGFQVLARVPVTGEPPAVRADQSSGLVTAAGLAWRTVTSESRPAPPPAARRPQVLRIAAVRAATRQAAVRLRELGHSWLDPLLAIVWLAALETEAFTSEHRSGPLMLSVVVVAVIALAGLWRRRAPVAFLVAVSLAAFLLRNGLTSRNNGSVTGIYTVLVPPYAVGAYARRPRAAAAIVVWAVAATAVGIAAHAALGGLVGPLLAAGTAFSAGVAVRAERDLAARLRDSGIRLAAERAGRIQLAVMAERARIARDLHSLVAHSVVAMVAQAEAAQDLVGTRPDDVVAAVTAIEDAGREALAELRRILGVLRRPGEAGERRPPPGFDQIHALVQHCRHRGQPVEFTVEGEPDTAAPGVGMIAYQILEHVLSGSRDPSAQATVLLRFGPEELGLELTAAGPGTGAWPTPAIRTRVAVCGGELAVTPAGGQRSRLAVRLPYRRREALA